MKKRLFLTIALFFAPAFVLAAQTPVTQIDKFNSAATKIDDLRVATNVRLAAAQSNFTEIYTALDGAPWLAQTTAPNIHSVFWLDTAGAPPAIKYWDGDSWEVAAAGGDGTYTLPTASAETKGGVKIGARLTMTGEVLSADVQTTDISGKQDILVSGTNIKTVNSTSLLGSGNIDVSSGSMTYPGAGVPISTGTAWGASLTLATTVGATGSDSSLATEQAVRELYDSLPVLVAPIVASGTIELNTTTVASSGVINSGESQLLGTHATATDALTTDSCSWEFIGDPVAKTGFVPSANGMLTVWCYVDANGYVQVRTINNTASPITLNTAGNGATIKWMVHR